MIAISNSSPLIALARSNHLHLLKQLFGRVYIPDAVFEETVLTSHIAVEKTNLMQAIDDFITVMTPQTDYSFSRNLGKGEKGVLNLALQIKPAVLLIDDKKARNEAKELGLAPSFTTDVLKIAEKQKFIPSYNAVMEMLRQLGIYLPE